jgi:hypothetical protein
MVTVFLVDDHEVVRRGLVDLLGGDPEPFYPGVEVLRGIRA